MVGGREEGVGGVKEVAWKVSGEERSVREVREGGGKLECVIEEEEEEKEEEVEEEERCLGGIR